MAMVIVLVAIEVYLLNMEIVMCAKKRDINYKHKYAGIIMYPSLVASEKTKSNFPTIKLFQQGCFQCVWQ